MAIRSLANMKVAVVGAGVSGLAVARRLQAEGVGVVVYERRDRPGGVWVISRDPDQEFASPAYESLETNFPRELMEFSDQPWPGNAPVFPGHREVCKYLEAYSDGVPVRYNREVLDVYRQTDSHPMDWRMNLQDTRTGRVTRREFHAVVIATGTFDKPFEPEYTGLEVWKRRYPGSVSHAKTYREPTGFSGKNVLVVGNSASGWEISLQIANVASKVWVSSTRPNVRSHERIIAAQGIRRLLPGERTVEFDDDTTAADVDSIVFCTGYLYSVPFVRNGKRAEKPIWRAGFRIDELYEHIFWRQRPTLMFAGIPKGGPTFLVSQAQGALIARFVANRWGHPSEMDMLGWALAKDALWSRRKRTDPALENEGTFHTFTGAQCKEYVERLSRWCAEADERFPAHVSDGNPPFKWTRRIDWVMENRRAIRNVFVAKGRDRHKFHTPESLGFAEDASADDTGGMS